MGQRALRCLQFGFLPVPEIAVIAAVSCHPKRAQFDNHVHFLKKLPVMADNDCTARPSTEQFNHGLSPGPIKIVRRLIKKQEIRLGPHDRGKGSPGALAS